MKFNISDKIRPNLVLLIAVCSILFACGTSSKLTENQFILTKNKILLDGKKVKNKEVYSYIKQKPTPKSFIFFRRGGKHRVVLNHETTAKSAKQLLFYYRNLGYLDAEISTNIKFDGKTATQYYSIDGNKKYTIGDVFIEDNGHPFIKDLIEKEKDYSLINKGDEFNFWNLKEEHARIYQLIKNNGYYTITKDHLTFEADTIGKDHTVDIYYTIADNILISDSVRTSQKHKRYHFDEIDVYIDVKPGDQKKRIVFYGGLSVYFPMDEQRYTEKIIRNSIEMKGGDYFSKEKVDESYSKLLGLGVFRGVKFNFEEINLSDSIPKINSIIELISTDKYEVTQDIEIIHSSGRYGLTEKVTFRDPNLFSGAEAFQVAFSGTAEKQEVTNVTDRRLFNSTKWSVETNLGFPRFLSPVDPKKFLPSKSNARTNIALGYNRLNRPDFGRSILNSSFGYSWREGRYKSYQLRLVEVSSVFVDEGSDLSGVSGSAFNQQFTDHLITSTSFLYTYNNQDWNKVKDHNLFNFRVEYSGHILNMLADKFGLMEAEEGQPYKIFGNAFTQYTKLDLDYRYYFEYQNHQTLALRVFMGAGVAYGNSKAIPFQKQYFVGGSNDLRSFDAYSLGPGSYVGNDTTLYYSADLKFEVNMEYRFNIAGNFRGALFLEAGNIWDNRVYKDEDDKILRPKGVLSMDRFISDLALGSGLGIRYDFSFLVFRFDFGYPLYNPTDFYTVPVEEGEPEIRIGKNVSERWANKLRIDRVKLNIGIGYPF